MAFPYTKYDALICDGAIRSGKTVFMMLSFVDDAMRRYNNQRFGICGKTVDSTVKNLIMPYLGLKYAVDKYRLQWRRTDKLLIVSDGEHENTFEIFGGKDESSFALIQGRTLAGILFDEVALQPRSFVEQGCARCSVEGSKLWFNCNPAAPTHWFFKEWISKPQQHNALHIHFLLNDNPALSENIIRRYESMYTGVFYDRYIRGLWVAAEGAIYRKFNDTTSDFILTEPPKIQRAMIGVDFGGGKSAHAFSCVGYTQGMQKVCVLDEYRQQDASTPEKLSEQFVNFTKSCMQRWMVTDVYCDSAEQTLINGLRVAAARERLPINISNAAKKEINDRIRATCILMGAGRFFVMQNCKETIEALRSAVWDGKKPTEDVRLDDGTTNIDSLDAMEYAFERDITTLIDMEIRR